MHFVWQIIIKLPSDITSCCAADVKADSSLNAGGLFCSTDDGRIFAVQLDSHLYVMLMHNSTLIVEVDRKWKFHFRPKVTESRPKVTYHIRPKPYVPPKVKRDFQPKTKTETESHSYLSRQDNRSQQVPPSVRCPTIPCIWHHSHLAPSCQPCSVSLMTRSQGPTVPGADADNAAAFSV